MPRAGAASGGYVVLDVRTAWMAHDQVKPEPVRRRIGVAGNKEARVTASERDARLAHQPKRRQRQADRKADSERVHERQRTPRPPGPAGRWRAHQPTPGRGRAARGPVSGDPRGEARRAINNAGRATIPATTTPAPSQPLTTRRSTRQSYQTRQSANPLLHEGPPDIGQSATNRDRSGSCYTRCAAVLDV